MLEFNYCKKCGAMMVQRIRYNYGYPIIEYICPIHGTINNISYCSNNCTELKGDNKNEKNQNK